jgi:hypothetical protein
MARILRALSVLSLAIFCITEAASAQTAPPNTVMPPATALPHPQTTGPKKQCQQMPNGSCKKKKKKNKKGKNKKQGTGSSPRPTGPAVNRGPGTSPPATTPHPALSPLTTTPHPVLSPLPGAPAPSPSALPLH